MLLISEDQTLRPQEGRRKSCTRQEPTRKNAQGVKARIRDLHGPVAACTLKDFKSHAQQDQTQTEEEIFFPGLVNETEPEHDPRVDHEMRQFVSQGEFGQIRG